MIENRVIIEGNLVALDALRYTPSGVAVINCKIHHESQQVEAEVVRRVQCELNVQALGKQAHLLASASLGQPLKIEGFLAAKSKTVLRVVLHVTKIEFKGKSDEKAI